MKGFRKRKGLALLLAVSLVLQLVGGMPIGIGNIIAKAEDAHEETDSPIDAVTGSAITYFLGGASPAITYYIGGAGASDSNIGTDSAAPFATLARAVEELNKAPGDYDIMVLGDTAEPRVSLIGDGVNEFNVNIKTVTGSAIVKRNGDVPGDLITVSNHANLTLGESDDSYSSVLTIDGGRTHFAEGVNYGTIIKVNKGGSLVTHDRVVIQNIYRWSYSYNKYGGAVYNAGIFDMYGGTIRLCYASYGSGVYNSGTFRLYGGIITDNGYAYIGSGVYNAAGGLFEMYGGSITDNDAGSYAGGVGNEGVFRLFGGSIDNNYANSNGGVHNSYDGIIYMTGGAISNNRSDYSNAGIYTSGTFYMSGGSVSGNTCTDRGGAFTNYGFLEITGGTIENNVAGRGGAIYIGEDSTTLISGGLIQNNTATYGGAIFSEGILKLSGNAQIPAGADDENNLHLFNPLTIEGDISYTGSYALVLENYSKAVGSQWINGSSAKLVADNISKFYLINNNYSFDNKGYVVSHVQPKIYYVGGEDASDTNDGSQDNPFATLDYALKIGNDAISTFILQSDQTLTRTITIKGDITIKSDGSSQKVSKSAGFPDDYMFRVESGSLTLGDMNNEDSSDLLIFDGLNVKKNYGLLFNESIVNIYNGVTIRNFDAGYYFFINIGALNMYGGSVEYNTAEEYGIILNIIDFNMFGGSIRYNNGKGVYNSDIFEFFDDYPDTAPTFRMSGGSIYGNIADKGAAVYHKEGSIVLSGGAAFSKEGDLHNDIFMEYSTSRVTIGGELNSSDQIVLGKKYYYDGLQMLDGEDSLIRNNYHKFTLTNPSFVIDEQGTARNNKATTVYYISASGNDSSKGGINDPFETIQKAIEEIGTGMGTIILQSDITLNKSVVVTGRVNIQSDGEARNISRGETFILDEDLPRDMATCMFFVSGELSLGNMDGNDLNPRLYLNGNGEAGGASIFAIINNAGILELYPGVVLHNNISDRISAGVISSGDFYMYGGSIRDNVSEDESGVRVWSGTFIMDGGSISNNTGSNAGVALYGGSFIMNGGSITENIG
ncbi:MAG: hypothetical protein EWM47_01975, partial [Anaerolineaceae bacterium]